MAIQSKGNWDGGLAEGGFGVLQGQADSGGAVRRDWGNRWDLQGRLGIGGGKWHL